MSTSLLAPGRRSPRHTLGLALLTAATVWVVLLSWRVLTAEPARTSVPLLVLAVLVAGVGGAARWQRVPAYVYVPVQLVLGAGFVLLVVTGSPLPVPSTVDAFWTAYEDAVTSAQSYMAPVPASAPPIHPLLVLGGALGLLLADVLAGALRRVPAAALVLLSLYALPATVTGTASSPWVFVVAAAGFLGMLFLVQDEQVEQWGRSIDGSDGRVDGRGDDEPDPAGFGVRTGAIRGSAVAIGSAATTLAVALPVIIPTLDVSFFDGPGSGTGDLEVTSPVADMRRDLQRGADIPLVMLRSSRDQMPSYLRISVLSNYNGEEWTPGDRDIPEENIAQGEMPALQGVAGTLTRRETRYSVDVGPQFESTWLPTMAQVSRVDAGSDWRYDLDTMDFFATDDQTTAEMNYEMVGVDVELDPGSMDTAVSGAASVDPIFTELPGDLPSEIRDLALEVTADAPTRFRKAQALQQWFREDGGFVYDLDAVESTGSGAQDLLDFLSPAGRRGYCEQYSAAMAVMARSLGIPARVAVGFLTPEQVGTRTWVYSAHDLHAWPELYFPGSGWVRFEPTPAARSGQAPGYTEADLAPLPEPSTDPSPRGDQAEDLPQREDDTDAATGFDDSADDGSIGLPWRIAGGGALGGVVLAAVLLAPRLLRRRRSERRWASGDVEQAWAEVADTAVDLGRAWPEGRSPREQATWLRTVLGDPSGEDHAGTGDPQVEEALSRVVTAIERTRYAPTGHPGEGDPASDGPVLVEALRAGASAQARRRADWWPVSVLRRRRARATGERPDVVSGRRRGVVDQIG